ncbi:MAG: T9SS type A sorting domain-containing protein [Bacteroidia bacterium]
MIKIYPNPAHSYINVIAEDANENIAWRVFDMTGRDIPVSVNQNGGEQSTLYFKNELSGVFHLQGNVSFR